MVLMGQWLHATLSLPEEGCLECVELTSLGTALHVRIVLRLEEEEERTAQELFTRIMAVIANLSFNFNFFQPDCSVESPYWQNWVMPRGCNYFRIQ